MKKILRLCLLVMAPVVMHAQQKQIDNAERGTAVNQFNYSGGGWVHASNTSDPYFNKTVSYSNQASNAVTFSFLGNEIALFTSKAPHHGIVAISFDNGPEENVDLYSSSRQDNVMVYRKGYHIATGRIPEGNHTLKIRITGTKNPASSNTYGLVDYVYINSQKSNTTLGLNTQDPAVGYDNTAIGYAALERNIYNYGGNTAVGSQSLRNNSSAPLNTAMGYKALFEHAEGLGNVAVGANAMMKGTGGLENTAIGYEALRDPSAWWNTAVGVRALQYGGGYWNTAVGGEAGMPKGAILDNTTALGFGAVVTASNQIRLGNSVVTSIGGQVSWSTLSDGRFKKNIKEDVSGLEFIKQLRPVSYTVDRDALDIFLKVPESIRAKNAASRKRDVREIGFVAQEVESVVKKTGYVFNGVEKPETKDDHYSIRYAEFVVPLVKAVQELMAELQAQKEKVASLENQLKTTAIGPHGGVSISSDKAELFQNSPNPFSRETEIEMTIPDDAVHARVIVYNLEGKQLKDYAVATRGAASVKISGNELNAGMYLYALIIDGQVVDTKRMILTN